MSLPLLILQTGNTLPAIRARRGDFAGWMQRGMRLHREDTAVCEVHCGARPMAPSYYRAALVTGSASMVTERADWSEATAAWLRDAYAQGLPLLGICYGHQLIAHALGGEVGYNPRGREIGTVDIHHDGVDDPLFGTLPARFAAHATHEQSVLAAPPGSIVLARSQGDDCQAYRVGERCWGVQFHPEFSVDVMRAYIEGRRKTLAEEARDVGVLLGGVRPTPWARRLLRRFAALSRL